MRAAIVRNNRGVGDQGVVDTGKWHQVGLEFGQVDIEGAIEAEAGRNGADNLRDQTVEMLKAGTRNIQVAAADIVYRLVIHQESTVGVLNGAVGGQNGIVRFNDGGRHPWRRVDGELQLRLLAILGGETLEQKRSKTRASSTAKGVEDQETLQGGTVVWPNSVETIRRTALGEPTGNATNSVNDIIDELFSNCVVTTGIYNSSVSRGL